MLLDETHKRWAIGTGLLTLVAGAYYAISAAGSLNGPSGGSAAGLVFGIAAALCMLFAGLLGARRRVRTWRLGRAKAWMRGHIWLGLLTVPLILFHGGFRTGGAVTTTLVVLAFAVAGSGVLGLALQQVLPRLITSSVPMETVYEQIDHVLSQLRAEADDLVGGISGGPLFPEPEAPAPAAGGKPAPRKKKAAPAVEGSGKLKEFYLQEMRPWLMGERPRDDRFLELPKRDAVFGRVRTLLPPPLHETLEDLVTICEEKRQLELQRRLHGWLHVWLLLHVPLSAALLVLVAVHAVVSLRY